MTLIKSISGIRGTIGGAPGQNLTPIDIVECTAGYGTWIKKRNQNPTVIVGRDGRITGAMVSNLATQTLLSMDINVVDLGLSTTPTVEVAVAREKAAGGIIFTASHNPKQWNALKFLNDKGEFISAQDGTEILQYIAEKNLEFSEVDNLGAYSERNDYIDLHIDMILNLPCIDVEAVKKQSYNVVVDCINSTGAISVVPLLERLGCEVSVINGEITGDFAHNPEPLAAHLVDLSAMVKDTKADMGISIDPDVDRLAFVMGDGNMFGEEYTLVAVADFLLGKNGGGNTVSNLSSTRALRDITQKYGGTYTASAVGEVNVVNAMKSTNALIGGEGNGGVIYPELHYGRDALVGIAMVLSLLAERNTTLLDLRMSYPKYEMVKDKIQLTPEVDIDRILQSLKDTYKEEDIDDVDGVKINFADSWVHLRKSNTEPIIRVYAEAASKEKAQQLVEQIKSDI